MKQIVYQHLFNMKKKFFRDGNLIPDESLYFLIKFIPFAELRGSANTILNNNVKIKLFLILIITLNLNNQVFGNLIEIKVQIQDKIITNLDIENEKDIYFLNPKLKDLEKSRTNIIAIDSLINEIIKKKN